MLVLAQPNSNGKNFHFKLIFRYFSLAAFSPDLAENNLTLSAANAKHWRQISVQKTRQTKKNGNEIK